MSFKRIRRGLCLLVSLTLILSLDTVVLANSDNNSIEMYKSYERVVDAAEQKGVPLGMTYEMYCENYNLVYGTYSEYADIYINMFESSNNQTRSAEGKYYYNTGLTLPAEASYGKYNLCDVAQIGDIIYEANGGFGITGHIAIVEGIYTHSNGTVFIRVIEAGWFGVKRGILDDTRYDEKDATILRVSGATTANKRKAVAFCYSQLDKDYLIDFAKDTSINESDWYCSEMVWAAYKSCGIDIEVSSLGEPGITPRDILNSSKTFTITVSKR